MSRVSRGGDFDIKTTKRLIGWSGTYTDRIGGGLGVGPTRPFWRPTHAWLLNTLRRVEQQSRQRNSVG